MSDFDQIQLNAGDLVLEVVPQLGGSISAFYSLTTNRRVDWLRPASLESLRLGDRLGFASFPLVPWCNRIRDGHASFGGRQIDLPPHAVCEHPLHGLGWDSEWTVEDRSAQELRISFEHDGRGWPWRFAAVQHFRLTETELIISTSVRNLDDADMPVGIGHHPYFPLDGAILKADVTGRWLADDQLFPHLLVQGGEDASLRRGLNVASTDLDCVFSEWKGKAVIQWPDRKLVLQASEAHRFFHFFHPAGADFFCAEPVTNITDWLNLRTRLDGASVGGAVVQAGETYTGEFRLSPSPSVLAPAEI